MGLKIFGIEFEGPFNIETANIPPNRAAVYLIICKASDGKNYIIDVGESGEVGVRIANHDRRPCWERNCNGSLSVFICYMPSSEGFTPNDRRYLEEKIRKEYNPPCGRK